MGLGPIAQMLIRWHVHSNHFTGFVVRFAQRLFGSCFLRLNCATVSFDISNFCGIKWRLTNHLSECFILMCHTHAPSAAPFQFRCGFWCVSIFLCFIAKARHSTLDLSVLEKVSQFQRYDKCNQCMRTGWQSGNVWNAHSNQCRSHFHKNIACYKLSERTTSEVHTTVFTPFNWSALERQNIAICQLGCKPNITLTMTIFERKL